MSNPVIDALGGSQDKRIMSTFGRFMQMMQGKDPKQMINAMLQSGQINQQQLNQAQQMASQMQGMFAQFFKR